MAGIPVQIAWAAEDTPEALRERYRKQAEGEVRTRRQALWLLRRGWSMAQVAEIVGVHYRTVQRWVGWYREGGVAEGCVHHGGGQGQPAWLTPEQEAAKGAFTTAAARRWVADQFGVTYRPKGIYGLLRRVRCHPKIPQPIHAQADPPAQEAWKRGLRHRPPNRRHNHWR